MVLTAASPMLMLAVVVVIEVVRRWAVMKASSNAASFLLPVFCVGKDREAKKGSSSGDGQCDI